MEVKNEFKLSFDSKSVNESFCRLVVAAFVTPLDPTIEELTDLKTAVSEAVTNCIVHAYNNSCGKIYITGQILDDNFIKIRIKDKGLGIENVQKAMTPLFTTGSSDRSGLGFTVMQSFCDRLNNAQICLMKYEQVNIFDFQSRFFHCLFYHFRHRFYCKFIYFLTIHRHIGKFRIVDRKRIIDRTVITAEDFPPRAVGTLYHA